MEDVERSSVQKSKVETKDSAPTHPRHHHLVLHANSRCENEIITDPKHKNAAEIFEQV